MATPTDQRRNFLLLASRLACLGGLGLSAREALAASQTRVTGIRFTAERERMKMHVDLDELPAGYKIFTLENPQRIVLDLTNSRVATLLSNELKARGTVRRVRYGKRNASDLRIVLDVNAQPGDVSGQLYEFRGSSKVRLVVDLGMAPLTAPSADEAIDSADRRDIVIAIDAGHGGRDPGALGYRKTREKDVTLDIAFELERKLRRRKGFRPVLTRTTDKYIALGDRVQAARSSRADFLISIHADAYPKKTARGSSVFALSRDGASSRTAELLAQAENQVDKLFGEVSVRESNEALSRVLVDLARNAVLESSIECGDAILEKLGRVNVLHKSQVEQANFAVLRAPDVPSLLVETAFISNPREERRLRPRRHQRKLAGAIADGVVDYFSANPPPDSIIALDSRRRG